MSPMNRRSSSASSSMCRVCCPEELVSRTYPPPKGKVSMERRSIDTRVAVVAVVVAGGVLGDVVVGVMVGVIDPV